MRADLEKGRKSVSKSVLSVAHFMRAAAGGPLLHAWAYLWHGESCDHCLAGATVATLAHPTIKNKNDAHPRRHKQWDGDG